MLPNNDEIMYRYARMRSKEIQNEVTAGRDDPVRAHILRRRLTLLTGAVLIGLTLALTTLALGWWVL
jgi:hypothetical protein